MAIQKSYVDVYGATHADAYTRVESVYVTNSSVEIQILIYHNAAARSKSDSSAMKQALVMENTTITGSDYDTYFADSVLKADTKSPVVQAYAWLKAQSNYIETNWTTGTTDV